MEQISCQLNTAHDREALDKGLSDVRVLDDLPVVTAKEFKFTSGVGQANTAGADFTI